MRTSKIILATVAVLASVHQASAADIPQSSACTVMGIVSAGAGIDNQSYDWDPDHEEYQWGLAFGEGALGWTCGNWNFQADAAVNNFTGSNQIGPDTITFGDRQSHIGGAIFGRVADTGALGISASYLTSRASLDISSLGSSVGSDNGYRVGAFGDYFFSDQLTLSASAHYYSGTSPLWSGQKFDLSGFEFAAIAKAYMSENFGISARIDLFNGDLEFSGVTAATTGLAGSLDAEYLISNTPLSLFTGVRLANRTMSPPIVPVTTVEDMQAYVGLKFNFGGAPSSLVYRDRTSTYDNTSVFAEKLPNLVDSISRGSFLAGP